jgi:hypothetical protein
VLEEALSRLLKAPGSCVEPQPVPAITLNEALYGQKQVGPDGLGAEITAPDPASERVQKEEREGRQDQETHDVGRFLRPELDQKK